jgi:hypothetical protein
VELAAGAAETEWATAHCLTLLLPHDHHQPKSVEISANQGKSAEIRASRRMVLAADDDLRSLATWEALLNQV